MQIATDILKCNSYCPSVEPYGIFLPYITYFKQQNNIQSLCFTLKFIRQQVIAYTESLKKDLLYIRILIQYTIY